MNSIITPASMMGAKVLNTLTTGSDASTATITIAAVEDEAWVIRRVEASNNASGATDFDNLVSFATIQVSFGGVAKWSTRIHPGNGGTSSLEFENGPWNLDIDPGLYTGTKNEAVVITVTTFGTGISGIIQALYQ